MSRNEKQLKVEVEELLEKTVLEEATEAIWKIFEEALTQIDESKLVLLKDHLNGMSNSVLSTKSGIEEIELNKMIKHSKKELIELVRREKSTRH